MPPLLFLSSPEPDQPIPTAAMFHPVLPSTPPFPLHWIYLLPWSPTATSRKTPSFPPARLGWAHQHTAHYGVFVTAHTGGKMCPAGLRPLLELGCRVMNSDIGKLSIAQLTTTEMHLKFIKSVKAIAEIAQMADCMKSGAYDDTSTGLPYTITTKSGQAPPPP